MPRRCSKMNGSVSMHRFPSDFVLEILFSSSGNLCRRWVSPTGGQAGRWFVMPLYATSEGTVRRENGMLPSHLLRAFRSLLEPLTQRHTLSFQAHIQAVKM